MKFAALALSAGCLAVICIFAMQSFSASHQPSIVTEVSQFRTALERLRLAFPGTGPFPVPLKLRNEDSTIPARAIPLLSKAETLVLIAGAAAKYGVPEPFVTSIVAAESNFNCAAISPKGAVGLMQLMPDTAQEFGADPAVPAENVDAGTHYLRWLMDRYQRHPSSMTHVIAAYNAGPGNVDRYHGVPPFRETRSYVARVLRFLKQYSPLKKRGAIKG